MDIWLTAAGEYGITAIIAFYLLHRIEKKLDILIYAVQNWSRESAPSSIPSEQLLDKDKKVKQVK
ncbi:YvrJ family protein [Alteribacillus bidgolensis]|uniref:YvrJ protein family protein n=1 Tax=Alteribacillus bidgolensis TaxID=930129 RepID=A0A1G8MN23_9BACI|nr:YvrJ family protein [Alteribacillus bidgolensis]SDI69205.1 YvrJ protein family protein [Alteribacillus bidgolensis]